VYLSDSLSIDTIEIRRLLPTYVHTYLSAAHNTLDSVRASSSSAVTFLFATIVEKAAVGESEKDGKGWARTRGDQTKKGGRGR
jgi:hypothetical protein